jgi:hypothetical protein
VVESGAGLGVVVSALEKAAARVLAFMVGPLFLCVWLSFAAGVFAAPLPVAYEPMICTRRRPVKRGA